MVRITVRIRGRARVRVRARVGVRVRVRECHACGQGVIGTCKDNHPCLFCLPTLSLLLTLNLNPSAKLTLSQIDCEIIRKIKS